MTSNAKQRLMHGRKKNGRGGSTRRSKVRLGRYEPEETIGFLIWDTIRTFHRTFQKLVSLHGINFGLWPFLRALWTEDGIGVRGLAQRVHMAAPTTLKAVIVLEEAGLVYRIRDRRRFAKDTDISHGQRTEAVLPCAAGHAICESHGRKGDVRFRAERGQEVAQAHACKHGERA